MTPSQPNRINALASIVKLCTQLNEPGRLRAAVSPRSDSIARIRDLWLSRSNVRLLIYWGCYSRDVAGAAESNLVAYVEAIRSAISDNGPSQCQVHVIFTDTHAQLNGTSDERIQSYLRSSRYLIERQFWSMDILSDLVSYSPRQTDKNYNTFFEREIDILVQQSERVHGAKLGRSKAYEYLASNITEAGYILERFPSALFLHAGVSELNFLLPSLPKLYVFTGAGRVTKKPWFLPEK